MNFREISNLYISKINAIIKRKNNNELYLQNLLKSDEKKIIYCPIPKNASTLFMNFICDYSDLREYSLNFEHEGKIHSLLLSDEARNSNIFCIDESILFNDEYLKLVVLRNPYERLISAYLNKFIVKDDTENSVIEVIDHIYRTRNQKPDYQRSITFEEFVNYLYSEKEDNKLDVHWRPQFCFLKNIVFDYYVNFDDIDKFLIFLKKKFNVAIRQIKAPHVRNKYIKDKKSEIVDIDKKYRDELRKLSIFPNASDFYSPELAALVKERYSKDIELFIDKFGQSFLLI